MNTYKLTVIILIVSCLTACSYTSPDDFTPSSDDDGGNNPTLITYQSTIKSIIDTNCVMCHSNANPSGGVAYETYTQVRNGVENGNVLDRIMRSLGDPLIMPQGGQLPQASIDAIVQWGMDGYLEN